MERNTEQRSHPSDNEKSKKVHEMQNLEKREEDYVNNFLFLLLGKLKDSKKNFDQKEAKEMINELLGKENVALKDLMKHVDVIGYEEQRIVNDNIKDVEMYMELMGDVELRIEKLIRHPSFVTTSHKAGNSLSFAEIQTIQRELSMIKFEISKLLKQMLKNKLCNEEHKLRNNLKNDVLINLLKKEEIAEQKLRKQIKDLKLVLERGGKVIRAEHDGLKIDSKLSRLHRKDEQQIYLIDQYIFERQMDKKHTSPRNLVAKTINPIVFNTEKSTQEIYQELEEQFEHEKSYLWNIIHEQQQEIEILKKQISKNSPVIVKTLVQHTKPNQLNEVGKSPLIRVKQSGASSKPFALNEEPGVDSIKPIQLFAAARNGNKESTQRKTQIRKRNER